MSIWLNGSITALKKLVPLLYNRFRRIVNLDSLMIRLLHWFHGCILKSGSAWFVEGVGFNPPLVLLNPQVCIDPRKNCQNKSKLHCWPLWFSHKSSTDIRSLLYIILVPLMHCILDCCHSYSSTRVVHRSLFLDPTRPGETLTRPAIADKKSDPTRPAARPFSHM